MASIRSKTIVALVALVLPYNVSCDETAGGNCAADVTVKIQALLNASGKLTARTTALQNTILASCKDIASDLGSPVTTSGTLDQQVQAACTGAANAITTAKAGATITVAYAPPRCTIDAQAQLSCEASCRSDVTCQPGTVDVRCEPGDLSVVCSGTCEAMATCEATVQAPEVHCNGTCEGSCDGDCNGSTQSGGSCDGTCVGECHGNCTIAPGVTNFECGAMARCRGGCMAMGSAPQCEGELTPPTCEGDVDCHAGCQSQASFAATCEPAAVDVVVTGNASAATLQATLNANLPAILAVRDQVQALGGDVSGFASAVGDASSSLAGVPACALSYASQLSAAVQGAAAAATSINVTVTASVSVSGSATVSN